MYKYEYQTQYYETDQMGIIHHSNYIRWFESSRIGFLKSLDLDYAKFETLGLISPVLGVSCEYKAMVRFGDTVVVIPKVENYNGIRMEFSYEVLDKETGELRTTGTSKHCFINKEGRPISLKRSFPEVDEILRKEFERQKSEEEA